MTDVIQVALDSSGAGGVTRSAVHGELFSFFVSKNSMVNDPTVTITDVLGRTLLTATETGTTEYPVMLQAVDTAGVAHTNIYKNTLLIGTLSVSVTGGDASGSVTVTILAR